MKTFARVIAVNQYRQVLVICQPKLSMPNYCFPGGKVEAGEAPEAAASRELHEEPGIQVDGERLHHCLSSTFNFGGETWLGHFYVCAYDGEERPVIQEEDKISSAAFYGLDDLSSLPCDAPSFIEVARIAESKISAGWGQHAEGAGCG